MYVFFIVTSMSTSIHQEKVHGTFRRLLSMPVSRAELLGGKMLATMTDWPGAGDLCCSSWARCSSGWAGQRSAGLPAADGGAGRYSSGNRAGISTTRMRGAGVGALLVIAALLGGCMFPLDLMPPFLRT
jgi:hypothetical protein